MAKIAKGFCITVYATEGGVFEHADACLVVGTTDDPSFIKTRVKRLDPTAPNIAVLQAILDVRFAELKAEEGIE